MAGRSTSRRSFLKLAASSTVAAGFASSALAGSRTQLLTAEPLKPVSPNDRIRIASIGMGIIAYSDVNTALRVPGVEFVAAADLYDSRLVRAKEVYGNQIFTTRDYREILARPDIDAVIVATPDHWHKQIAIDAMEAGKHVYLEKPMVHRVEEGPEVIAAQERTGRVLQVGSQFASSLIFAKAQELFEAGAIGRLNMIEASYNRNSSLGAWQYSLPPDASPETVDWDTFLGTAPKRPFDPVRFFRWRNYSEYGTGVAGDLFVHLFTGIHRAISSKGPNEIYAVGGVRKWKDGRDAPDVMLGLYQYPETEAHPDFTLALQTNFAHGGGGGTVFRFIGDEGAMSIEGGTLRLSRRPLRPPTEQQLVEGYNSVFTFSEAVQQQFVEQYRREHPTSPPAELDESIEYKVPQGYDDRLDHFADFFAGIREGKPVVEGPVFGYRAAAPPLLANLSYETKRPYAWDPDGMRLLS